MMHHHHHPPPITTTTGAAITTPYILLATTLFFFLLVLSFTTSPSLPHLRTQPHASLFPPHHRFLFHNPNTTQNRNTPSAAPRLPPTPPSIAYLLSGSANDSDRIIRLLYSIYHPRNHYLLNLDRAAPQADRDTLALRVQSIPLFRAAQNVQVIGKADYVFPVGPSSVSSTLHGASILLRVAADWDWFINLSANDYPLVTQDDLLHILSYLPKDLNFVNHSSYIGWRESRKLKPIIVDPALYLAENSEMFYATEKRQLPDAFRLFTGSSSAILTRKFVEFCVLGVDNLPRTLLMYLSNTPASNLVYFPTILCNSRQFNRTTINHSLQYVSYDSGQEPLPLNSSTFDDLIQSGAAFASPFLPNDPILDRIDLEVLEREPGKPVPGGWCLGESENEKCSVWGDADVLKPGPGAKRLEKRLVELLSKETVRSRQCVDE
ncbi:beta-glucuronosyltransferase GlcAT14A-like [Olea europaea var. sylvestris]|uniref:beta-glucuronosyltransferase GlcAT14A-like n=1 Tax=Olea europaea var. sylvestris TaxID=158386 RepID=UPI000C1D65D4|nr:beta-glucuronosyltransferase GlcAT14A-like [Olea europaea var. sylvestris]